MTSENPMAEFGESLLGLASDAGKGPAELVESLTEAAVGGLTALVVVLGTIEVMDPGAAVAIRPNLVDCLPAELLDGIYEVLPLVVNGVNEALAETDAG